MSPSRNDDHYATLGINRHADIEQIKAAYRSLALVHHPDRKESTEKRDLEKESKIRRINAAYDVLSNEKGRKAYDRERFGESISNSNETRYGNTGKYVGMTEHDVDRMFSGLNTFERFTTAEYYARRSYRAPLAIGRRRTNFEERKAYRASRLPSKATSLWLLLLPFGIGGLWAYNINRVRKSADS
uniref:Uncharacterized protein AlNc14C87G5547 n=1 Tax=Albugo laibachii Nc14 TaxID=890382 RepID=F0WG15_9STRA|nr:conserved hypothetical protein [Albugo laibachii Nc14]|eukprot:CCA20149.1 conserved hypothetical protein [Albugo laibachii Nc14]